MATILGPIRATTRGYYAGMSWFQKTIQLPALPRGFHLVTSQILKKLPELEQFKVGLAHFFICHTSASLTINENADPSVRTDFESHFNKMVPENGHQLGELDNKNRENE